MNNIGTRHMLFIVLILLMQASINVHAIDHSDSEHTEICSIFKSVDKLSVIEVNSLKLINHNFFEQENNLFKQVCITKGFNTFSSRDPPVI